MLERAQHDETLLAAIRGVDAVKARDSIGAQALGYALRRWTGRVVGGLRLERAGEARGGVLWRVVAARVDPPLDAPPGPPDHDGCGDCGDCGDSAPHRAAKEADESDAGNDTDPSQAEGEKLRDLHNLREPRPADTYDLAKRDAIRGESEGYADGEAP